MFSTLAWLVKRHKGEVKHHKGKGGRGREEGGKLNFEDTTDFLNNKCIVYLVLNILLHVKNSIFKVLRNNKSDIPDHSRTK